MTRSHVTRTVGALLLAACAAAVRSTAQEGGAILRVVVQEAGTSVPLWAADVRVLRPDSTVLAKGITDAQGLFVASGLPPGDIVVEYQLDDYVNHPDRKPLTLHSGANSHTGLLTARNKGQAYLVRVAAAIARLADTAASPMIARQATEYEWKKIEQLKTEDQIFVAKELSTKTNAVDLLADVPSFRAVMKTVVKKP